MKAPKTNFEEKEYETLMNQTLGVEAYSQNNDAMPAVYSPGQVLEKHVGFDFSIYLVPTSAIYKILFGSANNWPAAPRTQASVALPAAALGNNCFLQYKRPQHFTAQHQKPYWVGEPFYRFDVRSGPYQGRNHEQLEALVELGRMCKGSSIVRYACPATYERAVLNQLYTQKRLLDNSVFVDPRCLGQKQGGPPWHNYWAFKRSANGYTGRGNPDGEEVELISGDTFWDDGEYQPIEAFPETVVNISAVMNDTPSVRRYLRAQHVVEGRARHIGPWVDALVEEAWNEARRDIVEWAENMGRPLTPDQIAAMRNASGTLCAAVHVGATARALGLEWVVKVRGKGSAESVPVEGGGSPAHVAAQEVPMIQKVPVIQEVPMSAWW